MICNEALVGTWPGRDQGEVTLRWGIIDDVAHVYLIVNLVPKQ